MNAVASNLKEEEVLEAAIIGLPRVAQAIAQMPEENRTTALKAAERSYCQTAADLGYGAGQANGWAATVMARLRGEIEQLTTPIAATSWEDPLN